MFVTLWKMSKVITCKCKYSQTLTHMKPATVMFNYNPIFLCHSAACFLVLYSFFLLCFLRFILPWWRDVFCILHARNTCSHFKRSCSLHCCQGKPCPLRWNLKVRKHLGCYINNIIVKCRYNRFSGDRPPRICSWLLEFRF